MYDIVCWSMDALVSGCAPAYASGCCRVSVVSRCQRVVCCLRACYSMTMPTNLADTTTDECRAQANIRWPPLRMTTSSPRWPGPSHHDLLLSTTIYYAMIYYAVVNQCNILFYDLPYHSAGRACARRPRGKVIERDNNLYVYIYIYIYIHIYTHIYIYIYICIHIYI